MITLLVIAAVFFLTALAEHLDPRSRDGGDIFHAPTEGGQ